MADTEQEQRTRQRATDRNGPAPTREWSTAELADDPGMVISVFSEWESAQHAVLRAGLTTWIALVIQPTRMVVDRLTRI